MAFFKKNKIKKIKNNNDPFYNIVENAFCFLERSIKEINSDTKYSVIHYYHAFELFFKARLLKEHWTLIISNIDNKKTTLQSFKKNNFHSVSLKQAIERITKICKNNKNLPDFTFFIKIHEHRNNYVHFHNNITKDKIKEVAVEQLKVWFTIKRLLQNDWKEFFKDYQERINEIDLTLCDHGKYLDAKLLDPKFQKQLENYKKKGFNIINCPRCNKKAMTEQTFKKDRLTFKDYECLLCGEIHYKKEFECKCGKQVKLECFGLENVYGIECNTCECGQDIETYIWENYLEKQDSINCQYCGFNTVLKINDEKINCLYCGYESHKIKKCLNCQQLFISSHLYLCGDCETQNQHEDDDIFQLDLGF